MNVFAFQLCLMPSASLIIRQPGSSIKHAKTGSLGMCGL